MWASVTGRRKDPREGASRGRGETDVDFEQVVGGAEELVGRVDDRAAEGIRRELCLVRAPRDRCAARCGRVIGEATSGGGRGGESEHDTGRVSSRAIDS